MASDLIKHVSDASFDQDVLKSSTPVLVDFWAEWCGPCRAIAPILDDLADELDGQLKVAKVNVDEHPELAKEFSVRSIPTMIIMKNGQVSEQMTGAMSKPALKQKLEPHL